MHKSYRNIENLLQTHSQIIQSHRTHITNKKHVCFLQSDLFRRCRTPVAKHIHKTYKTQTQTLSNKTYTTHTQIHKSYKHNTRTQTHKSYTQHRNTTGNRIHKSSNTHRTSNKTHSQIVQTHRKHILQTTYTNHIHNIANITSTKTKHSTHIENLLQNTYTNHPNT